MARKKHAKHSKNTILASSSARHPFSKLSASAATAVVGASLALSVTPALAQETTSAKQQETTVIAAKKNNQDTPKAPAATSATPEKKQLEGGTQKLTPKAEDRASNNDAKPSQIKPDTTDTTNTKINVDENNAGTMPNAYAWGSSDNTYSVDGETHTVTFNFAKPEDGGTITDIAIFPAQNNGLTNDKSKRGAEYYSGDPNMHQSFSGTYKLVKSPDGSATLTMSNLFRDGNIGAAEKYAANRSIFVYVTAKDGTTTVYKTNAFRAATLVPPKTAGSVVLKYNQPLTEEQIQAAITAAANAETARGDKKSVNDQIVAASKSNGVFTTVDGSSKQVPDTLNDKLNVKSDDAYDKPTFEAINKEISAKDAKDKTYVAGAKTLNTYMVTDLGFKSDAIPLPLRATIRVSISRLWTMWISLSSQMTKRRKFARSSPSSIT